MSQAGEARGVEALHRRVERALADGASHKMLEPMLQRLVRLAPEGSAARLFAHRHLAELVLERDPWSAALNLRRVLAATPRDAIAQSLMALAQALLGNYKAAISAYRQAIEVDPDNPWYHHNLGHLLDVAMDQPRAAWPHFERALSGSEPPEDEIIASAAHCAARLGDLHVAEQLAREAVAAAPNKENHQALLSWIERGAPVDEDDETEMSLRGGPPADVSALSKSEATRVRVVEAVPPLLRERMSAAGLSDEDFVSAHLLWDEYCRAAPPNGRKPEVYAAAVHYAVLRSKPVSSTSQAEIAELYGVSPGAVGTRFRHLVQTISTRI